jgi:hypothetical protein
MGWVRCGHSDMDDRHIAFTSLLFPLSVIAEQRVMNKNANASLLILSYIGAMRNANS